MSVCIMSHKELVICIFSRGMLNKHTCIFVANVDVTNIMHCASMSHKCAFVDLKANSSCLVICAFRYESG